MHLAPRNRFRLSQAVPWIFNKNQPASACIQWLVISDNKCISLNIHSNIALSPCIIFKGVSSYSTSSFANPNVTLLESLKTYQSLKTSTPKALA